MKQATSKNRTVTRQDKTDSTNKNTYNTHKPNITHAYIHAYIFVKSGPATEPEDVMKRPSRKRPLDQAAMH